MAEEGSDSGWFDLVLFMFCRPPVLSIATKKMAKNTANSAFRKIDVDQYNEDNYREDEGEAQSPPIGPDENEITNLLNQYPFAVAQSHSIIDQLWS